MANSLDFYPWHQSIAEHWLEQTERLSHAILLYGPEGVGKRDFAHQLAAHLFCESSQAGRVCQNCVACEWMKQGQHPDYLKIRPDILALAENDPSIAEDEEGKKSPSKEIGVDQIRAIENWLHTGATRASWKIVVIYPVETMNMIAANSLLKILEEPPPNTLFLLVTHQLPRVMPTIRSRCRLQALPVPDRGIALQWLENQNLPNASALLSFCGGAPLQALTLANTPEAENLYQWVETILTHWAKKQRLPKETVYPFVEKQGMLSFIRQLQKIHTDLVCVHFQLVPVFFPQWQTRLQAIQALVDPTQLTELGKYYNQQIRVAQHPLNQKLFVDTLVAQFENLIFNGKP